MVIGSVKGEGAGKLSLPPATSPVSDISLETKPNIGRISGPTRRSTKGGWTEEEDELLRQAVTTYGGKNWKKIAEHFQGRNDVQCLHRWQKVLNPELVKGPWSKEEDDCIIELVKKHGCKKWSIIAKSLNGRIGKQCRERWHNHLNPAIKKDAWTAKEEAILIQCHQTYGNRWAEIAKYLPGRADNSIKNHWNCSLKKRLESKSAYGPPNLFHKSDTVDLDNHMRESKHSEVDSGKGSIKSATPFDKLNSDTLLVTSNIDYQSASLKRQNLDLNCIPPISNKPAGIENQLTPSGTSTHAGGEVHSVPKEDFKCTTSESHYGNASLRGAFGSPRSSQEDGLDHGLTFQHVSQKLKETSVPSLHACASSGNIISRDPPSPMSILRSKAESFETPSIIRKRVRQSSKTLFVEDNQKDTYSSKNSLGDSNYFIRNKSLKNIFGTYSSKYSLGDSNYLIRDKCLKSVFDTIYMNNGNDNKVDINGGGQFVHWPLARRLEDEFQMEQNDPSGKIQ